MQCSAGEQVLLVVGLGHARARVVGLAGPGNERSRARLARHVVQRPAVAGRRHEILQLRICAQRQLDVLDHARQAKHLGRQGEPPLGHRLAASRVLRQRERERERETERDREREKEMEETEKEQN
mgnify:CR=1 FL=1